ncbi:uncharacterized protein [Clytia hemisphaerica]|uniref:uncharacterized protein n=1 Tax=Clytia hemisphaerica TaxID=252671 RepID=UPI0034D557D5
MKLYFHIHLGGHHNHNIVTAVLQSDEKLELKSCLQKLCARLNDHAKTSLNTKYLEVSLKQKVLEMDTDLSSLQNGCDLKVVVQTSVCDTSTKYEKTVINKDKSAPLKSSKKTVSQSTDEHEELLKKADELISKSMNNAALAIYKEIISSLSSSYEATFGIAYILFKAKRFKESLTYFEKLLNIDNSNDVVVLDYARSLIECKHHKQALNVLSRSIEDLKRAGKVKAVCNTNVVLAEALESMDEMQNAFQIYLSVSQMTEKQNVDALLGYARVGYQLGLVSLDDVFIVVLNAIALRKNDVKVQHFFAKMVQQKNGMECLQRQMNDAWSDVTAVVYIATFLRECGAIDVCLKLLEHALRLAPKSIDVALLTAHVFENKRDLNAALKFVGDFIDSKHDRQVLRKIDLSKFTTVIKSYLSDSTSELTPFEVEPKEPSPTGSMANVELQLLALYFTVIKILFVEGKVEIIPSLVKLMKPLFTMQNDLHKTLIRNEQAFFSCIDQLIESPVTFNTASPNKLYVIGDSHVLPIAWQTVKIKEKDYMTKPILVTGLKIWHLRQESQFYTKKCYDTSIQQMESGTPCLFILGEIDCREGVRKVVEKCLYDSVKESIEALVDIYVKTMSSVKKRNKSNVYVHPVPCVLKETCDIVMQFNSILKERVMKIASLTWLDFMDQLIDERSGYLKEEYSFDGAHIHPKYISVLQDTFEKVQ